MKLTQHQRDLLNTLNKIPNGIAFRVKDVRNTYGYPHTDASSVLQNSRILGTFVRYADEPIKSGAIHYVKSDMFDFYFNFLT